MERKVGRRKTNLNYVDKNVEKEIDEIIATNKQRSTKMETKYKRKDIGR